MNGAETIVRTLVASGVDICFANPGTSEMHFMAALDRLRSMRSVLCLSEGVATGAADGYGRMNDKPAVTLLHCGPGLANGISNLHNARRARTPIVNLVGDQASYHKPLDPPLAADTEGLARDVSGWVQTSLTSAKVGNDVALAIHASQIAPGQIATLILPSDVCWGKGGFPQLPITVSPPPKVQNHAIELVVKVLASGQKTAFLLGGKALRASALAQANYISAATGAKLFAPSANSRIQRGRGRHSVTRLPYSIDEAVEVMADTEHLILVGADAPVAFFAYPQKPSTPMAPGCQVHTLARPEEDLLDALIRICERLSAPQIAPIAPPAALLASGEEITADNLANALTSLLPEQAIVVDESVSFGRSLFSGTANAAPHDWLQLTGGAIGSGIPLSIGAAIAAPNRRVVTLQADGSALYSVNGLWTQARENLSITTIILSNRKYAILLGELKNVGAEPGELANEMFNLTKPDINWTTIASGFGVASAQARTMSEFTSIFSTANASAGPYLIELVI